ncbi:hypothetical protein BVRB_6g129760 isoform B [Beta vulgaris subsp. vulgaris]|nr:hypothetical protein BVRB_6g129760 isoform B [Beta vulgaris subsp. vulgaris]
MECMVLEDFCSDFTTTFSSGDDFFVDQLLNFNNNEEEDYEQQHQQQQQHEPKIEQQQQQQQQQQQKQFEQKLSPTSKKIPHFLSPPLDSVLSVPAEEADLEWLSHFVEESFSQFSTPYPTGLEQPNSKPKPRSRPSNELDACFAPSNLSKARRSKRARTGGRVWTAALSFSPEFGPHKKQKKREFSGPGLINGIGGPVRRCSHCGVQKTPQWRAGPMGAKSLCNACGVRYKSGRLLPEYRPACSPTFSSELHSNSHRKVLEMRKKKETSTGQPESGSFSHPVSSFG